MDALEQLGYGGPLLDEQALLKAALEGLGSAQYVDLCMWLGSRLKDACDLEESLSSGPDDVDGLKFEMSGFLRELRFPNEGFLLGLLKGSVQSQREHLHLLLFLSSELQAAQILSGRLDCAQKKDECPARRDLHAILQTLELKESTGKDVRGLFSQVEEKMNKVLADLPAGHVGNPVLKSTLSHEQWEKLNTINSALSSEYECRRRMLIKRLDVTVQSFGWSDRAKVKVDSMAGAYQPKRHSLRLRSSVGVSELLAAREELCNVVKTSSGSSTENTCCAVNKILMGRVPDRGGRPSEIQAPPPEMPAWRQRQDGGRGRGGWNHGGYRGKRGRYYN